MNKIVFGIHSFFVYRDLLQNIYRKQITFMQGNPQDKECEENLEKTSTSDLEVQGTVYALYNLLK